MKSYKIFAGIIFMLLVVSATAATAFTPRDEGFVEAFLYAHEDDRDDVKFGNTVEFSIVIKNLWNDSISNLTIFQEFLPDTEPVSIANQPIEQQNQNFTAFSTVDDYTGTELKIRYLNITENNMTVNIDHTMVKDDYFAFNFVMNFTSSGTYTFTAPELTYYDHWGDKKTAVKTKITSVNIVEIEVDPRTEYVPDFETTEPNYRYIIGGLLGIFVVAILGRALHFKKPVST